MGVFLQKDYIEMITKTNPKIEHKRNLEVFFMKLNGPSNQSKHITNQEKNFDLTKVIENSD